MDVARFEIVLLCSLDRGEGLDCVVRRYREDQPAGGAVECVPRTADTLDQGGDLPRRVVLDDLVHGPDVDAELEGRGRDKAFDLPALESRLDPLALLAGQRAVVDRDILTDHREAGAGELRQGPRAYRKHSGPALLKRHAD